MNHVGVHQRAGIGGGAKKKKKSRKLGEDEMRLLLKENKKRIGGMTKQLYDLEHQAHSNRKEVEGVRASVQHILKQHDRVIKELDSDGGNRKMIGIKINEQVMEVSNILKDPWLSRRTFPWKQPIHRPKQRRGRIPSPALRPAVKV